MSCNICCPLIRYHHNLTTQLSWYVGRHQSPADAGAERTCEHLTLHSYYFIQRDWAVAVIHREMVVSEDIQGQHAGVLDSLTMEEIQTETSELSRSVQMAFYTI